MCNVKVKERINVKKKIVSNFLQDARMDTVKMAATLAKAFDLSGLVVW